MTTEEIAIAQLLEVFEDIQNKNPYAYFELARTRQTGWMAWITSKPREEDPMRIVIAKGQGDTPGEACERALESIDPSYFGEDDENPTPQHGDEE